MSARLVAWPLALLGCAALAAADLLYHAHPHFGWDGVFAFHAALGLGAAIALAVLARLIRPLLARDEGHYDR